ncbi:hypothetical protein [Sphingomonas sp. MM-1]|uniref:hypothetical protein n=1 Tax=Sphingomonas sp. MM-1 TaxID=745310 RepID=UPI000A9DA1D3|nr:hypothetical protein [Sphingomonas sp. MM-1]
MVRRFQLYSACAEPGSRATGPSPSAAPCSGAKGARADLSPIVTGGTADNPRSRANALAWFAAWNARTDRSWTMHPVTIDGGTHAANATDAYRTGLRLLFRPDE